VDKRDFFIKQFGLHLSEESDIEIDEKNIIRIINYKKFEFEFSIEELNRGIFLIYISCSNCNETDTEISSQNDEDIDSNSTEKSKIDFYPKIKEIFEKNIEDIMNYHPFKAYDSYDNYVLSKYYPLITKLENKMRYILTKYMFIKKGKEWYKDNIPDIVKSRKEKNENLLYTIDFIQINNFIFSNYLNKERENIIKKAKRKGINTLDKNEIEKLVNINNWDLFFDKVFFNIDKDNLKNKWAKLYKLRNKIAHNNHLKQEEIFQIQNLYKELYEILEYSEFLLQDEKYIDFLSSFNMFQNKCKNEFDYINDKNIKSFYKLFDNGSKLYEDLKILFQIKNDLLNKIPKKITNETINKIEKVFKRMPNNLGKYSVNNNENTENLEIKEES